MCASVCECRCVIRTDTPRNMHLYAYMFISYVHVHIHTLYVNTVFIRMLLCGYVQWIISWMSVRANIINEAHAHDISACGSVVTFSNRACKKKHGIVRLGPCSGLQMLVRVVFNKFLKKAKKIRNHKNTCRTLNGLTSFCLHSPIPEA